MTESTLEQDAARYRYIRERKELKHGNMWVVQYYNTKGKVPGLQYCGYEEELDAAIDAARCCEMLR